MIENGIQIYNLLLCTGGGRDGHFGLRGEPYGMATDVLIKVYRGGVSSYTVVLNRMINWECWQSKLGLPRRQQFQACSSPWPGNRLPDEGLRMYRLT